MVDMQLPNGVRSLNERAQGAFLGAAVGDALGWPNEDRSSRMPGRSPREVVTRSFQRWVRRSGGRYFPYEEEILPGEYSDDTQLVLCTARSLLKGDEWYKNLAVAELPMWTMYERGGGSAVKNAAEVWSMGNTPWETDVNRTPGRRKYFEAGGNGAAMRILPHVVRDFESGSFRALSRNIAANGIITHGHPRALVGAAAYGYAVWCALNIQRTLEYGGLIEKSLSGLEDWGTFPRDVDSIWPTWQPAAQKYYSERYQETWEDTVKELKGLLEVCRTAMRQGALAVDNEVLQKLGCFDPNISGAGTVSSAAAIFMASRYANDPINGVLGAAFAHGADTDTIASMTGGILGAIHGTDWLSEYAAVQDAEYLKSLATSLAVHGPTSSLDSGSKRAAIKKPDLYAFMQSLSKAKQGDSTVLPDGREATVSGTERPSSRTANYKVTCWKLNAKDGQTLHVKRISRPAAGMRETSEKPKFQGAPMVSPKGLETAAESQSPSYLSSLESLQQHFRAQLEGLSSTDKGDKFTHFVQRLVPQTRIGAEYDVPILNKNKSVDGGVDLVARRKEGSSSLYVQSKLWVDRAETIDSVLSKFQAHTSTASGTAQGMLIDFSAPEAHFLLVTLSPLSGILERYEKTEFASKPFYRQCKSEARIHFLDGHEIFQTVKSAYVKVTRIKTNVVLNLASEYISVGNVHIGVITSHELKFLYSQFGDAIFFENVRDFLGIPRGIERHGRTTPNSEIVKTIVNEPGKLLSRNNGLVFGAERVEKGKTDKQLVLTNGSIVNGCQTTMCVVESPDNAGHVLVKIVETGDAWDITKSANYQTSVPDIDLELARYLRPQVIKKAAAFSGVGMTDLPKSAFQILDEIYERRVAYDETRLLYIGLLSRSPNNVFAANYTELEHDLIARLYVESSYEQDVFETLFALQGASQKSLSDSKHTFDNPAYAKNFERLYADDSLAYRCYLSILALCVSVNVNIAERYADMHAEIDRTKSFLKAAKALLNAQPERYSRFHAFAVKMWMQDMLGAEGDAEVKRDMWVKTKGSNFTNMFRKLCMEGDLNGHRTARS